MPNNALKALAQNTTFAGIQYHDLNGCRNIIQAYIENNYLDKESDVQGAPVLKGGLVRLDPQLYAILNPKPSSQTHTIRKDAIFKSLTSCTGQSVKSGGGPQKIMREVVIQGNMIKAIEESLTQSYKVAAKYIESVNKLPEKGREQRH